MKRFSIKAAERLSGIKAQTLRVWEQRYGLLHPSRSLKGNQREYSNDELKTLLKIVYLNHQGYKIGQIARLKTQDIEKIIGNYRDENGPVAFLLMELKESIIDFDEDRFQAIIHSLILRSGIRIAMIKVLFPLLNQVGLLWMTDKVMPGQEHFASNIVIRKLVRAIDELKVNRVQRPGLVLLLTPEGEYHEIALLFFRYLLMANGYNTLYLGASVSNDVVKNYYDKFFPTHILLNFTNNLQCREIPDYLSLLRDSCPRSQIVISGAAIRQQPPAIDRVRVLNNEAEMIDFCDNIFEEDSE